MISIGSNASSLQMSNLLTNITDQIEHKAKVISSGKRILTAADDPAGIAIASSIRSDRNSYSIVEKNINSGRSLLDVSNSALSSATDILGEMKNLALESKNETLSVDQRNALQSTFVELQAQYEETVTGAEMFGQNLLKNAGTDIKLQTGISAGAGSETTLKAADTSGVTLGIDAGTINVTTTAGSDASLAAIDLAMTTIGTNQAIMGSQSRGLMTRLDSVKSLGENLTSALSRVEDADIAKETSEFNLLQTQQQMSLQTLSIVNSFPQNALALMR